MNHYAAAIMNNKWPIWQHVVKKQKGAFISHLTVSCGGCGLCPEASLKCVNNDITVMILHVSLLSSRHGARHGRKEEEGCPRYISLYLGKCFLLFPC